MYVRQFISKTSGNPVANQFVINSGNAVYFQSYSTIIAKRENGVLTLDRDCWDYSRTTAKYRNQFTGYTTDETKRLIKSGEIKLANLN